MSFSITRKKIILILSVSLLSVMMFMLSTLPVAAESTANVKKVETFTPDDPEEFIKQNGWEKPTPDAKLVEVSRVTYEDTNTNVGSIDDNTVQPQFWYSIRNVRNIGQLCGSTVRARTSGTGNVDGVLSLGHTTSVSNTYSANVGVSASTVPSAVGFDVTHGFSRLTSYAVNTNGKNYQIVAYDDYEGKSFDVYNAIGPKVGNGTAMKQVGFCYAAYEI